jgi:hypothetical protein
MRDLRCVHSLQRGCTNPERQVAVATKFYTAIAKRWHEMTQLVETLHYSRKVPSSFSDVVTGVFLRPHCGPAVESTSNRNEYQKYFLGGGGLRWSVRRADILTTFMCRLS